MGETKQSNVESIPTCATVTADRCRRRVRRRLAPIVAGALAMLALGSTARAVPVTLAFTVNDFPPTFAGTPAPVDPVSGVIIYEAANVTAPIESLTSISLAIGSHSFAVGELGFTSSAVSTSHIIGGTLNGVTGVGTFTNDFSIQFDRVAQPGVGANFVYASADLFGIWRSTKFTSFSLTAGATPVPETGSASLLLAGLVIAASIAWRRKRDQRTV
jgi:hypothetical protein